MVMSWAMMITIKSKSNKGNNIYITGYKHENIVCVLVNEMWICGDAFMN